MIVISGLTKNIKSKRLYIIMILFLLIGLWFEDCYNYNNFKLLLMLTVCIFFVCLVAFRKYERIVEIFFKGNDTDLKIKEEMTKLLNRQKSREVLGAATIFAILSNIEFFYLNLIPFNPIGLYIALWLFIVLFVAGMGYISYILYIFTLYNITKLNLTKYNYYEPANTQYLVAIYNLYNTFSLNFLVVGFLFTVIYAIVAPPSMISIPTLYPFSIDYLYEYVFIWSWIVIIIGILFGYIFLTLYPHVLIKRIILNMKNISKNMISSYVEKRLPINISLNDRIMIIEGYVNILDHINSTKSIIDYEKANFFVSFMIMIFSLSIPTISFLETIIKIQEVFLSIKI